MPDVIAMVLAGGRVEEFSALTAVRPKAAVPFGGQYRIVDFALSGLMRADLERVGVLSLYRPFSLIDHLGSGEAWDFIGRGRGIKILPPYVTEGDSRWYRGTADAVWQNLNFITDHSPRDVLILSGDHIFNMDFGDMIRQHRRTSADLTMAVKQMEPGQGSGRFGFAELADDGRVIGYQEKPAQPRSRLVSLTVYLFRTEVLLARLDENVRTARTHQLYSEVLPAMVGRDRVFAYRYDGYWNYPRSVDEYHQAHMDLLGAEPRLPLDTWSLRTRPVLLGLGDMPPARYDSEAICVDSVVCAGVHLSGEVRSSVLSPGVRVEAGARVTDSVLLHDVVVRAGARVDRAVLDKGVEVEAGAVVGDGPVEGPNRVLPAALASGVCLVGKNSRIPAGARLGRNCVVQPEVEPADWDRLDFGCGHCVGRLDGGAR